jgi:hypothetical protein
MKRLLNKLWQVIASASALMLTSPVYALDSYRYLHVTIETPWRIFLFLLIGIFAPFVVIAGVYWWRARRMRNIDENDDRP